MMLSATHGDNAEVFAMLLPDSDVGARNIRGRTALGHAARKAHVKCIEAFFEHASKDGGRLVDFSAIVSEAAIIAEGSGFGSLASWMAEAATAIKDKGALLEAENGICEPEKPLTNAKTPHVAQKLDSTSVGGQDSCMETIETENGEAMGGAAPKGPVLRRVIKGFLPWSLSPAVDAISRHCRDIHNTTIHLSKTALGCFEYDAAAKAWGWLPEERRPQGWEPVVAAFSAGIEAVNASRVAKHAVDMAKHLAVLAANPKSEKKEPALGLIAALGTPSVPPSFAILDLTLSEKIVREWIDPLDRPSPKAQAGQRELPLSHAMFSWRKIKAKGKPKAKRGSRGAKTAPPCPSLLAQPASVLLFSPATPHAAHAPRPAYARIPSNMARLAWRGARDSIATAIASQIEWLKTPSAARVGGLPSLPGYRPKDKLPAFSARILGSAGFPSLRPAHDIRRGEDRRLGLWAEALRKFNSFELLEHVARMMGSRYSAEIAPGKISPVPKIIRIIPSMHGRPQIQLVVEIPDVHPEGSFLHELAKRHQKEWELKSQDKAMMNVWLLEILAGQTWDPRTMDPKAPFAWASLQFAAAGIDPGTTNIASVGFSAGRKMLVFGGRKVEAEDAKRARRIDKAVSAMTLASPIPKLDAEIKAAVAAGLPKPMSAVWELRRESHAIHSSQRVQKLRDLRQAGKDDAVERISSRIAQEAFAAGVGIVVFSRNHGLKSASGKGRAFDKRSYAFPHSQLAKRTREKLWVLGIGMAEQEESGTSKASSVDGDRINTHAKGALQMAEGRRKAAAREAKAIAERGRKKAAEASASLSPATPPAATPAAKPMASLPESGRSLSMQDAFARKQSKEAPQNNEATNTQRKSPRFSGIRGAGGERNTFFRTRALTAREQAGRAKSPIREKLHADGQAALNAIRKASPGFKVRGPVRLGHQILLLAGGCWMEWAAPGLSAHPKKKGAAAAKAASS